MNSIRTFFAICVVALPAGAFLAGCGGDDEAASEDPQTVLDDTFTNDETVTSGDLTISFGVSAEGDQGGNFEGSLSGPFQSDPENPNSIPQLDWTASASGEGGGQSIDFEGGIVLTEDNAYVEYNDSAYEVGAETFTTVKEQIDAQAGSVESSGDSSASFQAGCAQALEQAGATDTSACDIDLTTWLTNLTNEGTEDVGGADSVHISGDANVEQILTDFGALASAVPGAAASGIDPSQLGAFSSAVTEATIDVYSTVDANLLSKLEMNLAIDPSAITGGAVAVPIENVDINLAFEIADINGEQTIEAPDDAQPIDQLLSDLGVDPSALDQLGAIPGLAPGTAPAVPGGGGGGAPGAGAADDYLACLEGATTPDEINACASEL